MSLLQQQSSTNKEKLQHRNKRTRRFFSRKRKFIAGLFSAILPGLGHIYLGLFKKGITFLFILILDGSAMLYFSSKGMHINVPLLILLGLLIPVTYFYNLYDVLQAADYTITLRDKDLDVINDPVRKRHNPFAGEGSISFGILLVVGGTLLILFYQKPAWLERYIELHGQITIAVGLVIVGVGLLIREMVIQRISKSQGEG
ncbi:hypothetical protein [Paenibacillus macquariensis]|uniref:TM2 domain-containing protein n=1 Tax=Paenibacillus macquariensis TaxID=948756 RepID=A0ABY1K8C7_9BACL|nr:hypothetical protein [Paenibacillus macquariensis]MEC0093229.1 hypothetical protein [Paenibacillus macquariensis]OAB27603.1 hypothetical protein PMSM_25390 [Paenibacillus macquariensis subsp. macquariensis]SIR40313.1 hypothetical protein SAMN05421578_1136 [Paenibacillus macquariensis]